MFKGKLPLLLMSLLLGLMAALGGPSTVEAQPSSLISWGVDSGPAAGPTATVSLVGTSTLTVIKTVINDNGGTAVASDWVMDVTGENISDTGFTGTEVPGVTVDLDSGPYSVNESVGPTGYLKTFSTDCAGIISSGESRTCTITSNDIAPKLTVIKTVVNNFGGTAVASDWVMDIAGANVSNTGFSGTEGGVTVALDAGTYTVSESGGPTGYTTTLSTDCSGAISS